MDALAVLRQVRADLENAPKKPYVPLPPLEYRPYPPPNPYDLAVDHRHDWYDHPKD